MMVAALALLCGLNGCHEVRKTLPSVDACETWIKSHGAGASGTCKWSTGWSTVDHMSDEISWTTTRSDGSGQGPYE